MRRSMLNAASAALALVTVLAAQAARADDLRVMSSGGLTAALQAMAPAFEARSGHHVVIVLGPSMGTAPEAIPNRLARGEQADLLLMVGDALGGLVKTGAVLPESRVDIADSKTAMAVKAGAPVPDIATLAAFKKTLLAARSIAYSDSASGVYIEREMYGKLGLKDELSPKSRMIVAERVGNVVARDEAEIGFQQVSELKPVKGITIVGEIPAEVQNVTVFSAGIPRGAKTEGAARELIAYIRSPEGRAVVTATGLEPIGR